MTFGKARIVFSEALRKYSKPKTDTNSNLIRSWHSGNGFMLLLHQFPNVMHHEMNFKDWGAV